MKKCAICGSSLNLGERRNILRTGEKTTHRLCTSCASCFPELEFASALDCALAALRISRVDYNGLRRILGKKTVQKAEQMLNVEESDVTKAAPMNVEEPDVTKAAPTENNVMAVDVKDLKDLKEKLSSCPPGKKLPEDLIKLIIEKYVAAYKKVYDGEIPEVKIGNKNVYRFYDLLNEAESLALRLETLTTDSSPHLLEARAKNGSLNEKLACIKNPHLSAKAMLYLIAACRDKRISDAVSEQCERWLPAVENYLKNNEIFADPCVEEAASIGLAGGIDVANPTFDLKP